MIRERVEVERSEASLRVLSPEDLAGLHAQGGDNYCDSNPYGIQVIRVGDEIVLEGYETVRGYEFCGWDANWKVRVRRESVDICASEDTTGRPPVGLGDGDEGSFAAPVLSLTMSQDQFLEDGFSIFGRPPDTSAVIYPGDTDCGLLNDGRIPYSVLIYPVALDADGEEYQPAGGRGIAGTVESPALTAQYGKPALSIFRGDIGARVRADVFGLMSRKERRYHPDVPVRISITGDAASLGGLCVGYGCRGAGTAVEATWGDVQAGRVQYVPAQPWGDGMPAPGLSLLKDGFTFEVLGDHAPDPYSGLLYVSHDYQYRVELSADEVAYGDSVQVTLTPYVEMEDGTEIDVDPYRFFLVDRMIVTAGYTTFHEGARTSQETETEAMRTNDDGGETPMARSSSGAVVTRFDPQDPHIAFVPPDEFDDQCAWGATGPESFPLRFSGAGLSTDYNGLGPWTGLWGDYYDYSCKTTAIDVPYLAAMTGEVWLVADGFEPAEGDVLEVEVRVESDNMAGGPRYHRGAALLTVRPGQSLSVTATPDTLRVGESALLTIEGVTDPDASVALSAPTPYGRLARVVKADTTAVTGLLAWSEIVGSDILFIADGERPDSTTSITIGAALEDGASDSVTLTIEVPEPVVEILDSESAVADHVQVSLWENAYDLVDVANSAESVFVDDDPDHFVVRVTDPLGNTDSDRVESLEVTITSDAAGTEHDRTVTLAWETGPDTGVFETPTQILMARDFPISGTVSGPAAVTDDNYVLFTQVGIDELGPTYGPVPDDSLGDRSHTAVAGGTITVNYSGTEAEVPVCRADELRRLRIESFSMLEPYFDDGYRNRDNLVVKSNNGVWDDENGDGVISSEGVGGEQFEVYIEISSRAGTGRRPLRASPGMNGIVGRSRDRSATDAHHTSELHRAKLSWDQACLVIESSELTSIELGVDFYTRAFGAFARGPNTLDVVFGAEDYGVIEAVNDLTQPGDIVAVYTTSINVILTARGDSTQSALGIAYFPGTLGGAYDGLLGGRRYMLLDPTAVPGNRLLAHEIGHVATEITDPSQQTDDYYFDLQYVFPSILARVDSTIGVNRRLPRGAVDAVQSTLPGN